MAATLDEHQQFVSEGGKPLVGGKAFYGDPGSDPVTVPKDIFSDPGLTLPLANPQDLDAEGRTVNKVYLDGKYSILVENVLGGQEYQNLFNGIASAGITTIILSNIIGATTIAATAGITSYVSNQQFVFKTISGVANDGPVTLNVDEIGETSVVKNQNQEIVKGEFEGDQTVIVAYNATIDKFEWVNQNNKVLDFSKGTDVASAATTDIWSVTGNTIHVTGTEGITSFGTALNIGARMRVIIDDVLTLTNSANLALPGGVDFTTAAGDVLDVYAETLTQFDVIVSPKAGTPGAASQADQEAGTALTVFTAPGVQQFHQSAAKAWININQAGGQSIRGSYNVASIVDGGTGRTTINFTISFSDANYAAVGTPGETVVTSDPTISIIAMAAGSTTVQCENAGFPNDQVFLCVAFFGDQT